MKRLLKKGRPDLVAIIVQLGIIEAFFMILIDGCPVKLDIDFKAIELFPRD